MITDMIKAIMDTLGVSSNPSFVPRIQDTGSFLALINSDEFIHFLRLNGQKIIFISGITLDGPESLKEQLYNLRNKKELFAKLLHTFVIALRYRAVLYCTVPYHYVPPHTITMLKIK
ncbi:hypothetical protein LOAG_07614 [Loa loa]|uniref:Uncharacterized protein n=1 Tax=Loa loa TaxID=7209 RepID=A0A1S0TVD7_LOALO|nr:hypothetical protein LOAG_07614 [Loa loa]EFO20875.1 hypothetical protein LOAG_07614 [Loa loa]